MKSWHLSRSLFLAVLGALLLNNSKGVSLPPCDVADRLRDAQQYDIALAQYTKLLKKEPHCATQGIDAIVKIRAAAFQEYERGKAFETAADLKASEAAYIQALKRDPTYKEAQQALQRVLELQESKKAQNTITAKIQSARALADAGFHTEAREKFKEIIEENPDILSKNEDVQNFIRGRILWLRWLRQQSDIFLNEDLPIALAVIFLGIIWYVFQFIDARKFRLYIRDFEKGGTELAIGQGLSAMVQEQFKNIDSQGGRSSPQLVAGPIEKIQTPIDVSSLVPSLRIFSLFADMLSRLPFLTRNTYILSGCIQPPSKYGVGITLLLQRHPQKVIDSCTIWQKDFDKTINSKADDLEKIAIYYRLTEAAAIWTLFKLQERTKLNIKRSISVDNWQSYACFRAGFYWRQQDENEKARGLFLKALALDKKNHFALCNLGIINAEEATQTNNYERAIERLEQAKNIAEDLKKENFFKDTVWYKAQYQLAATYLYKKEFGASAIEVRLLLKEIDRATDTLKIYKTSEYLNKKYKAIQDIENKACLDFLEVTKPMVVIMYADVLVQLNQTQQAEEWLARIDEQQIHDRAQYNLACYYSGRGRQEHDSEQKQKYYEKALRYLEGAFELKDKILLNWARKDPSLAGVRDDNTVKFRFQELLENYDDKN